MKKYAETENKQPFDWDKFLSEAIASPPSEAKCDEIELLSTSWVTCACGNQCSVIPRDTTGAPLDAKLSRMGGEHGFHGAIVVGDWELAQFWLKRIEQRSVELIQIEVAKAQEILRLAGVE